MFVAASNDLIAKWLGASIFGITLIFRILILLLPPLVGWGTYRLMKALAASGAGHLSEMPLAALTNRGADGHGAHVDGGKGHGAAGPPGDGHAGNRLGAPAEEARTPGG